MGKDRRVFRQVHVCSGVLQLVSKSVTKVTIAASTRCRGNEAAVESMWIVAVADIPADVKQDPVAFEREFDREMAARLRGACGRAFGWDSVRAMRVERHQTLAIVAALAFAACSSTQLETKWQAPSVERLTFAKIVALALTQKASLRRAAEVALCRQVTSVPCTPAYLVIPESEMGDVEKMKAAVQGAGFDGAVVFRVVSAEDKVTYVPPIYGGTFWGYYGYAYPTTYAPAYYRADKLVRVETSIYSLRTDRLLWVATTKTINPDSVDSLVEDVAKAVRRELEREELIPER